MTTNNNTIKSIPTITVGKVIGRKAAIYVCFESLHDMVEVGYLYKGSLQGYVGYCVVFDQAIFGEAATRRMTKSTPANDNKKGASQAAIKVLTEYYQMRIDTAEEGIKLSDKIGDAYSADYIHEITFNGEVVARVVHQKCFTRTKYHMHAMNGSSQHQILQHLSGEECDSIEDGFDKIKAVLQPDTAEDTAAPVIRPDKRKYFPNHVSDLLIGAVNTIGAEDTYTTGEDTRRFEIAEADDYGMPTGQILFIDTDGFYFDDNGMGSGQFSRDYAKRLMDLCWRNKVMVLPVLIDGQDSRPVSNNPSAADAIKS